MSIFRVENLTKQFSGKFVLSDFSFEIKAGDKVNIAGRSGIGKTTLFRLLLGFEQPEFGTIYFQNDQLTDELSWKVRRQVAYVSQDLQIGRGSVEDFFKETLSYKANQKARLKAWQSIKNHLEFFHLPETVLQKRIEELSGGEKQRIAIINALILERKVFFLDEITSALDAELKTKVLNFFLNTPDFTVLYISHDHYLPENAQVRKIELT